MPQLTISLLFSEKACSTYSRPTASSMLLLTKFTHCLHISVSLIVPYTTCRERKVGGRRLEMLMTQTVYFTGSGCNWISTSLCGSTTDVGGGGGVRLGGCLCYKRCDICSSDIHFVSIFTAVCLMYTAQRDHLPLTVFVTQETGCGSRTLLAGVIC